MKKNHLWKRALALTLGTAMLLSGCAGGGKEKEAQTSPAAESAAVSEGPTDYSKYNSYLDVSEEMYDMDDILDVYFQNVEYAADFALVDGGDYSAIKDAAEFYTPLTYTVEKAMGYIDEEPAYPDADAALKNMGDAMIGVMEALGEIGNYVRFSDYEKDSLAKAPELHKALFEHIETYDKYYYDFLDALDVMAAESRDDDMQYLLDGGQMIMYHASGMINTSQDVLAEIMDQIYAAMEAMPEDAQEFDLPAIDMSKLSDLFAQFNNHYEELTQALNSNDERAKVDSFSGTRGDSAVKLFENKVNALYTAMGNLANDLMNGADYADSFDAAGTASDDLVDAYNNQLV